MPDLAPGQVPGDPLRPTRAGEGTQGGRRAPGQRNGQAVRGQAHRQGEPAAGLKEEPAR